MEPEKKDKKNSRKNSKMALFLHSTETEPEKNAKKTAKKRKKNANFPKIKKRKKTQKNATCVFRKSLWGIEICP